VNNEETRERRKNNYAKEGKDLFKMNKLREEGGGVFFTQPRRKAGRRPRGRIIKRLKGKLRKLPAAI